MSPKLLALLGALGLAAPAGAAGVCEPDAEYTLRPEFPGLLRRADPNARRIVIELEVPADAEVLRRGKASRLGALEPGDEVWVEYDPESSQVTTLSARPAPPAPRSER